MRCELVDEALAKIAGISNPGSVGFVDPDSGIGSGTRWAKMMYKKRKKKFRVV
jgi:hypothetical protein